MYVSYSYYTLSSLTVSYQDHRLIMNGGLTASINKSSGLGARGKNDSTLLDSIDSKKMARNLSAAQKYIINDFLSRIHAIKKNILVQRLLKIGLIPMDGRISILMLKI